MKRFCTAIVTLNACAWPYILGAYAIWSEDYYRISSYVAAGAVLGGVILLSLAMLLVLVARWFPDKPFAKKILEASLPARKIAGGGVIIIVLGTAGLIFESFRYKPPHERSDRNLKEASWLMANGRR